MFLISDTHFGHANIIRYCERPFKNVSDMNAEMIRRWNSVVSPSDTIIHIGDFSFGKETEFLRSLNGIKILVRGNHDKSPEKMMEAGFALVVESAFIVLPGLGKCFITHYPIESDSALTAILEETSSKYHIHGHAHNGRPLFDGKMRFNVSVENINYTPIASNLLLAAGLNHQ